MNKLWCAVNTALLLVLLALGVIHIYSPHDLISTASTEPSEGVSSTLVPDVGGYVVTVPSLRVRDAPNGNLVGGLVSGDVIIADEIIQLGNETWIRFDGDKYAAYQVGVSIYMSELDH